MKVSSINVANFIRIEKNGNFLYVMLTSKTDFPLEFCSSLVISKL